MTDLGIATIDRGAGPPVLLLHGQPGDGASWHRVIERLETGHRVLAPDRPGYGATTLEATGMAANADLLADLLRRRGAVPATVVGHSWSGGVAVLMAARHPEVVRSLVLAGAVGTPDSVNGLDRLLATGGIGDALTVAGLAGMGIVLPRVRGGVAAGWRSLRRSCDSRPAAAAGDPGIRAAAARAGVSVAGRVDRAVEYLAATLPDEVVADGWAGVRGRGRRTFVVEQRALMAELAVVTGQLGALSLPVTVVAGEWDLVVPPAAARSLARSIPGAQLVRLPAVGHFMARDAPDRMAEVIEAAAGGAAVPPGPPGPPGPAGPAGPAGQ